MAPYLFRMRAGLLFASVLAILATITAVGVVSVRDLNASHTELGRAGELLHATETLLYLLSDAEASYRGFVLSGDERFLAAYHTAEPQVPAALARIRELVHGDPALNGALATLARAVPAKLDRMAGSIATRRDVGLEAARARVASGVGEALMVEIRGAADAIADVQGPRLAAARERHARAEWWAVAATWGASTTGGLVALILVVLARQHATQVEAAVAAITARAEVERREARMRALGRRVRALRDDAGAKLAQRLHEGVAQDVFAAMLEVSKLDRAGPAGPIPRERLDTVEKILAQALGDLRQVAHELRPAGLAHLPLSQLARTYVREFTDRTGLAVALRIDDAGVELTAAQKLLMLRALQEALTNVVKHADAHGVDVVGVPTASGFALEVTDDGRGIAPHAPDKAGALGLLGLSESAAEFGGTVDVRRRERGGTRFCLWVPRAAAATAPASALPPAKSAASPTAPANGGIREPASSSLESGLGAPRRGDLDYG